MPIERSSLTECWVGLVLISPAAVIYGTRVRCMNTTFSGPCFDAHLADGFQKRQRFDVADRAADLDHGNIVPLRRLVDAVLDLVGDVRNHLHRGAEIVAAALLADHALVDPPGGEVVLAGQARADVALVMAEIEIGLGPVIGDDTLRRAETGSSCPDPR